MEGPAVGRNSTGKALQWRGAWRVEDLKAASTAETQTVGAWVTQDNQGGQRALLGPSAGLRILIFVEDWQERVKGSCFSGEREGKD